MNAAGMHSNYEMDSGIKLKSRMTSMCQAGLDGVVDGNAQALEALAHMNDSYALGTGTSPCPVLDLVYLLLVMI